MNLLDTKRISENKAELTIEIHGQNALISAQLFGFEKIFINWNKKSFRMWAIKKLMRGLKFDA